MWRERCSTRRRSIFFAAPRKKTGSSTSIRLAEATAKAAWCGCRCGIIPGDTIYGMFARCETIVNSAETLLEGEVYHYHSKMIMKDAKVGGAWAWHQDYGYWYQNGVLFPLLTSAFIAVDPATRENGCMQVLSGSHQHGPHRSRSHRRSGRRGSWSACAKPRSAWSWCMSRWNPGDVLFFHANLLHRSDQNRSENPRWAMICCYNAARNDPYKEAHHPRYTPLQKVPDSAIREAGLRRFSDSNANVAWLEASKDQSARSFAQDGSETVAHAVVSMSGGEAQLRCYMNLMALDSLPRDFECSARRFAAALGGAFATPASTECSSPRQGPTSSLRCAAR